MFVTSILVFCLFTIVKCNNNNISFDTLNNELLEDTFASAIAYQDGEDIQLKSGEQYKWLEIILKNGFLEVEMDLKTCYGISNFCYNSTDKMDPLTDICFTGFCGFQVEGSNPIKNIINDEYYEIVRTMNIGHMRTDIFENCKSPSIFRMQYWETIFCNDKVKDYSCAPKMDKDNKIHIYVKEISPYCPVKILNAEIYDPTKTTTMLSTKIGTTTEKTEDASLAWYFWVIIVTVLIVIFILA
uniref:Uncharacterized protein n=1 Tax=Panagrolaimus sp. PS1159 TaxID=55785 RepID=A0AC35G955_9BILA